MNFNFNFFNHNIHISDSKQHLDLISFYIKYLKWFDPKFYNTKCLLDDKEIHISAKRQMGSTTSMILTALYKILTSDKPVYVFISSMNMHSSVAMLYRIQEILNELSNSIFNGESTRTKNMIRFPNGSTIKVLSIRPESEIRGLNGPILLLVDEKQLSNYNMIENIDYMMQCRARTMDIQIIYSN